METKIRPLRADEIEVRVQQIKETGCSLLMYKDARCDMRLLDETFGTNGWQRTHEVINGNLFCTIEIWDKEKNQWIKKQDVGTESATEKQKGQASDSFKRAGVNVGIGRELYDVPFIWISLKEKETFKKSNGSVSLSAGLKFMVSHIKNNENGKIIEIKIVDNFGTERYSYPKTAQESKKPEKKEENKSDGELITEMIKEMESVQDIFTLQGIWEKYPEEIKRYEQCISCKNRIKDKLNPIPSDSVNPLDAARSADGTK